jgi:hypothetical protein
MILNGRNECHTQDIPSSCVVATGRQGDRVLTLRSRYDVQPFNPTHSVQDPKKQVAMRMTGASPERCVKGIADRFAQLIFRRSTE